MRYTGAFSLAESVALAAKTAFVEPMREGPDGNVLELAFPAERIGSAIAVSVEQRGEHVRAHVFASLDHVAHEKLRAQLEHMLSPRGQ